MTTTEAPAYDRRTIREYLDSGADPAEHPEAHMLLETAAYHRFVGKDHRIDFATRWLAELSEKGVASLPPVAEGIVRSESEAEAMERLRYELKHEVELLTDDDLADRFLAGFPGEAVASHTEAAAEYHDMEVRRFTVEKRAMPDGYHCMVSGKDQPGGPGVDAIVIVDRFEETDPIVISPVVLWEVTGAKAALLRAVES